MTNVTIITLEDSPRPKMFLQEGKVWRDISSIDPINPDELRSTVDTKLKNVMNDVDRKLKRNEAITPHISTLAILGSQLLRKIVPDQLTIKLREVRKEHQQEIANGQNPPPPVLYVHMEPLLDWIPWELMYDIQSMYFFGDAFQIVRLPIVSKVLILDDQQERRVQRIHSILGKNLLKDGSQELENWHNTFAGVAGLNGHAHSFPSKNSPDDYRNVMALGSLEGCDIWHITCHGITEGEEYYLRLDEDPQQIDDWKIDGTSVEFLGLSQSNPLIFGNACSSTEALSKDSKDQLFGLGLACLDHGATAYIGTFAPISSQLATEFAMEFYRQLLNESLPIGQALFATKQHFKGRPDPSWMFYRFYGSPDTRFVMDD